MLVAQIVDPTAFKPWLDLLVSPGVPVIVTGFAIWLAYKYLPKAIDGSIEAQREIPKSINTMNDTLREGVDTIKDVKVDSSAARQDLDQLKHATRHMVVGASKLIRSDGIRPNIGSDVAAEFNKAKQVLENGFENHEHHQ